MSAMHDLISRPDYENWSEDDVWSLFVAIVERDCPLPGLAAALESHRGAFTAAHAQVARENRAFISKYYRTEDKRPIVNPMNIEHLTRLLQIFNRLALEDGAPRTVLDALFHVMRGRCGINHFYSMPVFDYFFPLHAMGAVVGTFECGPFLIISQGSTIGQNHNRYPRIEGPLLVGPGASVLGDCHIGRNVIIGTRALVIDRDIPDDTLVLGMAPDLILKDNPEDLRLIHFDLDEIEEAA